jgi:hypothetical protein
MLGVSPPFLEFVVLWSTAGFLADNMKRFVSQKDLVRREGQSLGGQVHNSLHWPNAFKPNEGWYEFPFANRPELPMDWTS